VHVNPPMPGASCGNNQHEDGEECDDGNKEGKDGCTAGCQVETDWSCPQVGPCTNNAVCGNGTLSSSEVCDDGNTSDGDGCNASCSGVEPGWQCRVPGKKCVPLCGDGVIIQTAFATEGCDDMNTNNDDGCSSTCQIEPRWSCMGTPSTCSKAMCGNSMVETGETCDKGEDNGLFYGDGTGCSKTCTAEPKCRDANGVTGACETHCGDGNIDASAGEECDDGNQLGNDGCSMDCKQEAGFTCQALDTPDTQECPSAPGTQCLVLPMIFRDFDPTTNPDFFYLGKNSVTCVPDASGTAPPAFAAGSACPADDHAGACLGLASDTLDKDGTPAAGKTTMCRCIFTDHDDTGVVTGGTTCSRTDGSNRPHIDTMIKAISDIKKWYAGDGLHGKLELAQSGTGFQFSSSVMGAPAGSAGTTVQDDIHANCLTPGARPLQSGFFPFDATSTGSGAGTKYCNLWPYWHLGTSEAKCATGSGATDIKGQWDPTAAWDNCPMSGTDGSIVPKSDGTGTPLTGVKHDFYYTSVARYLFRYSGTPSTLEFFGDDDVWVYVNGKLKLDLGAPHQQLRGTAAIGDGLENGKIYEIAVFHADRHPRDANYQLTLSSFSTSLSNCKPTCGDGVATATEECDLGTAMNTGAYGGCTADCHYGGWCGDATPQADGGEECDNGVAANGVNYIGTPPSDGTIPCTVGCKRAHYCGDKNIDAANGEQCDQGDMNGKSSCKSNCLLDIK